MNLSGNKIIAASALFLVVNLANAEAPGLVEFTSGTAAKAAEVNANFDDLKTYSAGLETVIDAQAVLITALQDRATAADTARAALEGRVTTLETESSELQGQITAFETGEKYTIAVYGDESVDPIGYTNSPNTSNDKQFMVLKTDHGMAAIRPGEDRYELYEYDALNNKSGSPSVRYTDSNCSSPVAVLSTNPIGYSMFFTTNKGVTDTPIIATSTDGVFMAEAGTAFSDAPINFYYKDSVSLSCLDASTYYTGKVYFPVVEMTEELHNLKFSYTSIRLQGFQSN
ncbi:MAG: hypothetical protein V7785_06125 [Bermanella sp.]